MIECKVTNDYDAIKDIYRHKSIWPLINKGLDVKNAYMPLEAINLGMYVNNNLEGLAVYTLYLDGLDIHPMIKKGVRKYARHFLNKALNMVNCNIYAKIPLNRNDLVNLSKSMGFLMIEKNEEFNILKRAKS